MAAGCDAVPDDPVVPVVPMVLVVPVVPVVVQLASEKKNKLPSCTITTCPAVVMAFPPK
jgi:hypothetical protein